MSKQPKKNVDSNKIYLVNVKHSISCKKGIIKEGQSLTSDDVNGGEETISFLLKNKFIIEETKK